MRPHYGPKKLLDIHCHNVPRTIVKRRYDRHIFVSPAYYTIHSIPPSSRPRLYSFISLSREICSLTVSARDVGISNIDQSIQNSKKQGEKTYRYRQSEKRKKERTTSLLKLCASMSGPQSFIVGKYCGSIIEIYEAVLPDTCGT